MQLCVRAHGVARVIHGPWLAAEAGSAPTIELQLDSKFHAPTSSGLTRYNSCSDARSAPVAGPLGDSSRTPLATNTAVCGI